MSNSQETANTTLSRESLIKATKFCLQNAKQFLDDAKLLLSRKSYGHAFSLAALAEEEISKALIYYLERIELHKFNKKKDICNHSFKQEMARINTLGEVALASLFIKMLPLERIKDPKKLLKRRNKIVGEHCHKLGRAMQFGTREYYEMEKKMNHFLQLEKRKQLGFYVDIDEKGEVLSPKDISCREAKFCINLVDKRHQSFSYLESNLGIKKSDKMFNKFMKFLVSNAKLSIYNTTGQLVRTLNGGTREAGIYTIKWDKKDNQGKVVPSGTYTFCVNNKVVKKVIL